MVLEVQEELRVSHQYQVPPQIPRVCFRTYDIRGPVDAANLTPDLAYAIGLAVGAEAQAQGERQIVVGRDGRLSGPEFTKALCAGLVESGMHVVFIGLVATPVLYFATNVLSARSGVMVTASHNPGHHNGFKIVLAGKTLSEDGVSALYQRIVRREFVFGEGSYTTQDVIDSYINTVQASIQLERALKVVLDCGNGAAGHIAPRLFRALGCEVVELHCEVDGRFPNHHPDPTVPENLQDLIAAVKAEGADVGLAFDGDADRVGMVTEHGEIIWPDRQLMLFAREVLEQQPGAEIIFDVKCTRNLPILIKHYGGVPIMWRTGHSMIKAKLFEQNAPLAGELSGHIFFKDEWFGFDDGMYVGARLLRILSHETHTASEVFSTLPNAQSTPELKLAMDEEHKAAFMRRLLTEVAFPSAEKITIDGLRLEYPHGFALIRPSNTSAYLTLRFEAETQAQLAAIQDEVRAALLQLDASLELPF